ncbi:MAG: ParA family protein, partial [Deltaproteobacteria bacterium]|nr:ParA family protein [Deltaproteobacteria bacterium]
DVARPTSVEGLSLVPSYKQMGRLPEVLAGQPDRAQRLDRRLAEAEAARYDVVVMDAPPSMGLTTVNILVAAREVVVPVAVTYLSLDGCAEVVDTVERVVAEHRCGQLRITRVVPTLYRKTALADEILEKLAAHFPGRVTEPLGFNVKIDEAQSHGKTIWQYAPWSRGAQLLSTIAVDVDAAGR